MPSSFEGRNEVVTDLFSVVLKLDPAIRLLDP
jgi:hypothetical protein